MTTPSRRIAALVGAIALAVAGFIAQPIAANATSLTTNDTASTISYSAGWTYTAVSGYYSSDAHYANTAGATATFSFTGTTIAIIGGKNSGHGRADVKICNGSGAGCTANTTIDTYSATTILQQTIFSASGLAAGAHQVIVTLRSDTSGTGYYSDVDAFLTDQATFSGTHYINNASGSGCSDSNAGTSTSAPWCDFAPVQDSALTAGSSLLLARGDTWTSPLRLTGTGTSSSWITLGAYGSGTARPIIKGTNQVTDRTVILTNPDYWHVQELEFTAAGEGLLVEYTSLGHNGLDVHGIYAHDMTGIVNVVPAQTDYPDIQNSGGITISAAGAPTASAGQTVLNNVSITHNVTHNTAGIYLLDDPTINGTPASASSTFTNVLISDNNLSVSPAPQLAIESALSPIVENNWVDCSGAHAAPQGTTCFFVSHVDSALIQNNVLINQPNTSSADETAIDLEYKVNGVTIRGNYFGDNAGAGIELLQLGRTGDYSTGTDIEDNSFYNNGGAAGSQKGQIAVYGSPIYATIQHNDYVTSPGGFISNVNGTPDTSNLTLTDNTSGYSQYPAAWNFSATQATSGWHYSSYSGLGTSWTDMPTFTSSTAAWSAGGGSSINSFTSLPGSGSSQWVARIWTAPQAGNIHIRGRAFKDDVSGNATSILIQQNSSFVWPTTGGPYATVGATDRTGIQTDVNLTVAAGDQLYFVVYGGASTSSGDATSWTPSITYY